jgi:GNAT superfamily N-acetyltransferase
MKECVRDDTTVTTIRACGTADFGDVFEVCNDGARAYAGVIAADQWREPYMPEAELRREMAFGVRFFAAFDELGMVGVMGLQDVADVTLIRHAYTRTARQRTGVGGKLLAHLQSHTDRPILIGTWKAATWAIGFYERHGFMLVAEAHREQLLRRYWTVPARQIDESVVLADARWFATRAV